MSGAEEVLLDLNTLAEGHKFLGLGSYAVSDDANWLAYSLDTTGYRQFVLHVKNLRDGRESTERIERVGSVAWATDNKTIIYTTEDAVSKRSDKVFRHVVGEADSQLIFEERDELFDVYATRSLDKKVIFLNSGAKTSNEVRFLPAATPAAAPKVVAPREADHEYRRRSLQRRALHHDQPGRQELPGGQSTDRRPVRAELEAVHRPPPGGADRRADVLRQSSRGVRA